jgi:hypothetical protein
MAGALWLNRVSVHIPFNLSSATFHANRRGIRLLQRIKQAMAGRSFLKSTGRATGTRTLSGSMSHANCSQALVKSKTLDIRTTP